MSSQVNSFGKNKQIEIIFPGSSFHYDSGRFFTDYQEESLIEYYRIFKL